MPGITLTVSGEADAALDRRLADEITRLTATLLSKELDRTTVILRHVPHDQWFIGGRSLAAHGKNAFRLEVTITDETNTRQEKAAYHREAHALLSEIIGDLHPLSNIHVIDCRATAYGYGGITQEAYYR
jgi:4-oxalocrotonate tautomerase